MNSLFSHGLSPLIHKKLILSVDDEDRVLRMRQQALESAGYTVLNASDGEQALRLFDDGQIDIALLDRNMPGIDGVTVAREMKSRRPHVPIILVTGAPLDDQTPSCLDGVFIKGDDPKLLMAKIEQLLPLSMTNAEPVSKTEESAAEVLGVYRPIITDAIFEEQNRLYDNEQKTRIHFEKLVLIEVMMRGRNDWEIDDFRQETPEYGSETACEGALLTTDGRRVIKRGNDQIFNSQAILRTGEGSSGSIPVRCAFFLHFYDPQLPLRWTHGEIQCPPPQTVPDRLQNLMPYLPAR